jgi:hypothetical protein
VSGGRAWYDHGMLLPEQSEMLPWYGRLIGAVVVAGVAWLAFAGWRNKDDFRITVTGGRVQYRGRFPPGRMAEVTGFFLHDLAPTNPIRVTGNWTQRRVLRVTVHGRISEGEKQRVRNFLKMTLKG